MSRTASEIATQPGCRRRAAEAATFDGLPRPGERVAVTGCGTTTEVLEPFPVILSS